MMKCIKYLLGGIFLCAPGSAMDDLSGVSGVGKPITIKHETKDKETKIDGTCGLISFRSIEKNDAYVVEALVSRCEYKEGLPQNTKEKPEGVYSWACNLIARQEQYGNPYSGLLLSIGEKSVGFLTMGVMPALGLGSGYNLKDHSDIIETFSDMGAIRLKEEPDAESLFTKGKYDRVEGQGLGFLLPILPNLTNEQITDALTIGVGAFHYLRNLGKTLPQGEGTVPGYVIGLFHPEDPLIPHLKAVGFEIVENEGFKKFYDKPRVMARLSLK